MKNKYPVSRPDLTGNEKKYLNEAIETGWVSSQGPFVEKLEKKFARYIGTKYAVACSSGTTGLTLALSALGIKEGDEVIIPDFTMIATAWAVSYLGARPMFVDCGEDLNMHPDVIEKAITKRTKAIIPVHIYGRPAAMKRINEIAYKYNLKVIEDACEAHGATIGRKKVGSFGDMGVFSLFGNKIITAGEGGLITTNDKWLYGQLKHLRSMAFDENHSFLHPKMAYNFRMTNLQAAVGLAQLERIDEFIKKREQIRKWYDEKLENVTIERPKGSVLWYYDILCRDEETRDRVADKLKKDGIETRVFFKPMHLQPMYRSPETETKSEDFSKRGLYLPTYTALTKKDVEYISKKVIEYYG